MSNFSSFQQLADGIWAALAGVNAGIIDLGDQTLIFDTTSLPVSAYELKTKAEELTGRPATFVINSHVHPDHIQGNIAFADHATIVSSSITRQAIAERGATSLEAMKGDIRAGEESVRQRLAATTDEAERTRLQGVLKEYDEFFAAYPTPADLRLPTLTFERQMTFHGSKRTAHLMTFGGAHSPCDAVLWLPAEGILFVGDLVIPGDNLIVTLGQPANWLPILDKLEALGAKRLVSGHGKPVDAAEGYAWARQYLTDLFKRAEEVAASGEPVESIRVPEGLYPYWYRKNIQSLIEKR
ncbi:MAG TPA: MBL fold metallo-hydrolase [Symbiobacteriaceae bacterium]|nr:MBL fold metallo-hydrolase [Symbiobacteriaceae bacterium]